MKYAISHRFLPTIMPRIISVSKQNLTFVFILSSFFCSAQVPLAEIEGRLSIYLSDDTTSVHIGKNAGINQDLTNKRWNTFVGIGAGRNNAIGKQNSFFGFEAGFKNSSGGVNTFYGSQSGYSNSTGSNNSYFGQGSGYSNEAGVKNSIFGRNAGFYNTGSRNCFIGFEAGYRNDDGEENIALGSNALYQNTSGKNNIAIGAFALNQAKLKNDNVAIGDSAMYGIGIINESTFFGQQNVAIGTRAFYGADSEFGRNSVAIGYEAGMDGGQRSVFIGYQSGKNIDGIDDVLYINNASGEAPLIYGEFDNNYLQINGDLESTGKFSIGTSPGNWKAAVREAGNAKNGSNVDVSNLAVMLEKQNPVPNEAVGLGFKSSSDDTDVGAAIIHERTASSSKGKLHFATKTTTIGGDDIPIHLTIDDDGYLGVGTEDPNFTAVIKESGNALSGDDVDISNLALVLERGSNTAGQAVGMGFQSSSTATTIGGAIIFERTGSGSKGHLHFATKESDIADADIPIRMTIEDFGNVGIGTTDPDVTLDVQGTIRGTDVFCGGMNLCSDMRLKRDFSLIKNPLSLLDKLNGYFHYWNHEEYPDWHFTDQRAIGFKAQEVEQILPEVVETMPDGYLAIDYSKMVPLLVESIKEQQALIDELKLQLEKRDDHFTSLLYRIEQIENTNFGDKQ